MQSNAEIIELFREHHAAARGGLGDQYAEIERCQRAYNGDTASYTGKVSLYDQRGSKKSQTVSFNKIRPYVSTIKGFFAQNRRKPRFTAKLSGKEEQQAYSEYCNGLFENIRENANADQIETAADGDMLVCGVGAIETNLVYGDGYATRNPNGEVEMMVLDPLSVGWDPTARMPNLIDSRFVFFKRSYRLQEALDLFDSSDEEDFESGAAVNTGPELPGTGGGMFSNLKEIYDVDDEEKKIVSVTFYQWFDVEKFYRAANPLKQIQDPILMALMVARLQQIAIDQEHPDDPFALKADAEVITCNAETKRQVDEAFDGIVIKWDAQNRRVYNYAVLSNKKVFKKGRSVCQSGFTTKFKTGEWNATKKLWTGIVGQMIDPQTYFNKALTELLFAIASSSKGGVMAERDAIADIADFEAKYAKTNGVVLVESGALSGGKIQPKREPYAPNGVDSLLQLSDSAINDVAGIDKSFLGNSDNKQETALLQRQRVKQVTAALACYVDNISLYQREHARLMLDLMRVYVENNEGETFRSVDEESGDVSYAPMELAKLYDSYDITIMEGPDSATEKQERALMLSNMGDTLIQFDPATAKIIYSTAIKYLPLDSEDKAAIRKSLVPEGGNIDPNYVAQLEEQVKALTNEAQQAQIGLMKSQAAKNLAGIQVDRATIRNKNMNTVKQEAEAQRTIVQAADIARQPVEKLPDVEENAVNG